MDTLTNTDLFVVVSTYSKADRYSDLIHLSKESAQEELIGMDHEQALPMKQHYTVVNLQQYLQALVTSAWDEGKAVGEKDMSDYYMEKDIEENL
jgi:hypothetical protein